MIYAVKKTKFIKACPFLRDLGNSYLCVNDDKVIDIILDPLINIEWNNKIYPTATEIPGKETCLFILDIKDDNRLFCVSRKMFLKMDQREIFWQDVRDAIILLNLNNQNDLQNSEIDFCSTCLYKVLIASSPTFQLRLSVEEKIRLGLSYILNKANEIYAIIINLSKSYTPMGKRNKRKVTTKLKTTMFKHQFSSLNWLNNLLEKKILDELTASLVFEWLQKFDEWGVTVSKIPDQETDEDRINLIKQSNDISAKLKEIAYDLVMKISYLKTSENELLQLLKNLEKVITISSVQFEDYIFICNQFLDNIGE